MCIDSKKEKKACCSILILLSIKPLNFSVNICTRNQSLIYFIFFVFFWLDMCTIIINVDSVIACIMLGENDIHSSNTKFYFYKRRWKELIISSIFSPERMIVGLLFFLCKDYLSLLLRRLNFANDFCVQKYSCAGRTTVVKAQNR